MAIRALRPGKAVGDRSPPVASIWADTPRPGTPGDDTITGTPGGDTLYGDGGDDTLYGVGGDDNLNGGDGHDRLEGGAGGDRLDGGDGNDTLLGGTGNGLYGGPGDTEDRLYGGAGDDILDGGGGRGGDLMVGGTGNDTYYVDKILSYSDNFVDFTTYPGDEIVELAGEGFDTIYVGLAGYDRTHQFGVDYYSLGGNEIEVLAARYPESGRIMRFTGNDFPNAIYGASNGNGPFGDLLLGLGGDDVLHGLGGNDELWGYEGNDVIVGGTGDDRMYGNSGDDIYYADSSGDVIFEVAGEGLDRVAASTSLFLRINDEIEVLDAVNLTSTNAMNLGGTNSANVISGNNGVNQLYGRDGNDVLNGAGGDDFLEGGGGNDTMYGGLGNDNLIGGEGNDFLVGGAGADTMTGGAGGDTYYVDDSGDTVTEAVGEGSDRVATSISYTLGAGAEVEALEAVNLTSDEAMDLTGNEFDNVIIGNNGANRIDGREGNDILTGAFGADLFAFTTALGANNVDQITRFVPGVDRILLDDAVFTGLTPGALPPGAYRTGRAAVDADDRIIYNNSTGALLFDVDGVGGAAAVQFATIGLDRQSIDSLDFLVI